MHDLPHRYRVSASSESTSMLVDTRAANLPALTVAAPAEFDGPGDQWSPETLLAAALANCFVLSFKAIANASGFQWLSISCRVEGELDKVDRSLKFTRFHQHAVLRIAKPEEAEKAGRLLEKAEKACLVSNSLNAEVSLDYRVETA